MARRRGRAIIFSSFIAAAILLVTADAQQQPSSSSSPLAKLPGALVERAAKTLRDGPSSVTNFARFNDTLVSLAGDDGIPFATSHEPTSGEECAALCAAITAKASAAAAKKKGGQGGDAAGSPPVPPRCFSAAFDDVKDDGGGGEGSKGFTCSLYGWSAGEPCPEVTIETSGGTTSYLDAKALSSSLGACAAGSASSISSASSSTSSTSSSPTTENTKSKKKAAAAAASSSPPLNLDNGNNKEKADALGAIADAVRSSLPPAPPDPASAASAASAAAASLASAAAGGDDAAARAQAWAAVVDAKPGAAVAVVGARPPISPRNFGKNSRSASAAARNLSLSFEYLGTVTDVASAAVCSGLCQQFVAGADNAGGAVLGVTEFGARTVSGRAGYYGVSDGPLQAHCVAASFYDGDAALGIDAAEDPDQSVGRVCDLFGVAPRGATVLLLEPEETNGKLARSTVTFIRPQRWSELDYALGD